MDILAAIAHPDDIEFALAGSLLYLKEAGHTIHFWNLANGCYGSETHPKEEIARIRYAEAKEAAEMAGAIYHEPLFDDLSIFYDAPSLARVAAVVREVKPGIILTHSPIDYMEDHQNAARLVVTAAFSRSIAGFATEPPREAFSDPVRIYHALPHGICGPIGQPVPADFFVDTGPVFQAKRKLLACHRSQQKWLDASQGMDDFLDSMEEISKEIGALSGRFTHAEGFFRHSHIGFAPPDFDPLPEMLRAHILVAPKRNDRD